MGRNAFNYLQVQLNQSECRDELGTLKRVDKEVRKYSLCRAGLELIQLAKQDVDFDVYNTRIWSNEKSQSITYKLGFNKENEKELALYNDITKLTSIERKIFLRNVVVHAGRKLIKAFDPASTIEIYELAPTSAPVVNVQVKNEVKASTDKSERVGVGDVDLGDFDDEKD